MAGRGVKLEGNGAAQALNRLAREQMKHRILADIRMDMLTCELEGWDKLEYLREPFANYREHAGLYLCYSFRGCFAL